MEEDALNQSNIPPRREEELIQRIKWMFLVFDLWKAW